MSGVKATHPDAVCGEYVGDNDATCWRLTCVRPKGHDGPHDNVRGDEPTQPESTRHRIYVASSWRNDHQPEVVRALREDGHDVYDFKNPAPGDNGFSWRQIGDRATWTAEHFGTHVLDHPISAHGFGLDMGALSAASAVVLVLPCGRSAHLEHGYAVGAGKLTIVYQRELDEPELMYRMCDYYSTTLDAVRLALTKARPSPRWQRDLTNPHPAFVNRCGHYQHRTCAVCGGCWRHGSCTCGPRSIR